MRGTYGERVGDTVTLGDSNGGHARAGVGDDWRHGNIPVCEFGIREHLDLCGLIAPPLQVAGNRPAGWGAVLGPLVKHLPLGLLDAIFEILHNRV